MKLIISFFIFTLISCEQISKEHVLSKIENTKNIIEEKNNNKINEKKLLKKQSKDSLKTLTKELLRFNAELFLEHEFYNDIKFELTNPSAYKTFKTLDKSFNLFVSIGGDGTILRAITFVKDLNIQ